LPIAGQRIYVAGSNANNIGNQAGGWTLTWQGGSTNKIPGTSILDGIREVAGANRVTCSEDASDPIGRGDVGIVVVGETPYAEGFGDVGGPRWGYDPGDHGVLRPAQTMKLNAADSAAVDKVCAQAAKCVVVVVSGRAMILDPNQLRKRPSSPPPAAPPPSATRPPTPRCRTRPADDEWDRRHDLNHADQIEWAAAADAGDAGGAEWGSDDGVALDA
jgi:hypothetical protein